MDIVVEASDTATALRALVERLGPDAVVLDTRKSAGGVTMVAAPRRPVPDADAVRRFRVAASALGFDATATGLAVSGAGPDHKSHDLWVRMVAAIERRVGIESLPLQSAPHIGVVGSARSRIAMIGQLADLCVGEPVRLVAGGSDGVAIEEMARQRRLDIVPVGLQGDLPEPLGEGCRLIADLGTFDARDPATVAIERQLRLAGMLRIAVLDDGQLPSVPQLLERSDAIALVGDLNRPGRGIARLMATGLPLAYVADSVDTPLETARVSKLGQRVMTALARSARPDTASASS